jgi:putative ABC transport system substrate-binding protein
MRPRTARFGLLVSDRASAAARVARRLVDLRPHPPHHPGMNRRRFLLTSLAGAVAVPLPAETQPVGKVNRIGFLSYRGCSVSLDPNGAFLQGLRELGYAEGRNLAIECRDARGRVDRFADLAAGLIRLKMDGLVAEGTPASLAAKQATTTIPIVMVGVADPVRSGLITSLARPGGNITGPSLFPTLEVAVKALERLKEIVPRVSRIALLRDPTNPSHILIDNEVAMAGRGLGLVPQRIGVRAAADFQDAFAAILDQRAQALLVYALPISPADGGRIAEFAQKYRLPAVTFWEGFAEQGMLMFYGTRLTDQYRRAVVYVDKILKGVKPADLPVEQPTKFELVINLKTAKALGLTIPPSLLARADQVIE